MPRNPKVVPFPEFKKAQAKAAKPEPVARQWTCKRCKHDIGVATSEIIQIRLSPHIKGLKVVGGIKRWVCSPCLIRGIQTEVF